MGFYTRYWSTLLKGPGATKFKERWEVRRAEKFGGRVTKLLFKDMPRLIEERHGVTKFLGTEHHRGLFDDFLNAIRKVCFNSVKIIFNQLTQDMSEIREEDGVVKQLADFWNKQPKKEGLKDSERAALINIAAIDKNEEKLRYRPEYNEVEAITIEAKRVEGDHQKFMDWLRTRVKQRVQLRNLLERYAWRTNISDTAREIASTKSLRNRLKGLLERISKQTKDGKFKGLSAELQAELNQICEGIKVYFRKSYLVRERAILMILKVLYITELADKYLGSMVEKHYLPSQQTEEARARLREVIVEEVGKEFNQVLAQEFRIVIHKLEVEESKAERLARAA